MKGNVIQINGGITTNVYVNVENVIYVKKIVQNPATCNSKNGKSIMCDEIIVSYDEKRKALLTSFNEKI